MIRYTLPIALGLALGGCNASNGGLASDSQPWSISCKGKVVLSVTGNVNAFSGINGSITTDCGEGAYLQKGSVAAPAAAPLAAGTAGH